MKKDTIKMVNKACKEIALERVQNDSFKDLEKTVCHIISEMEVVLRKQKAITQIVRESISDIQKKFNITLRSLERKTGINHSNISKFLHGADNVLSITNIKLILLSLLKQATINRVNTWRKQQIKEIKISEETWVKKIQLIEQKKNNE